MPSVIKYGDVSGVEGGDFEHAPVGLYVAKVAEVTQKTSKNNEEMVEVVFEITKDANGKKLKKKYSRLWFYAPLDPGASWARRLKDLVTGFGLKPKGGNMASIIGKEALIRLREDTDLNGDYRPNIGKILPLASMKPAEPEEDEELEEEEEEEESTDGALDDLTRAELKALIKEEGLDVRVLKSMSDDDVREAIAEARPEAEEEEELEEEEEEEEDDEEEEEDEGDNYDNLSLGELRQELKDRELESKGGKNILIARLRTDDAEDPV